MNKKMDNWITNIVYGFLVVGLMTYSTVQAGMFNKAPYRVCFTPGGHCTQIIVSAINQAKSTIKIQAYSFTSKPITKALINAHQRGLNVIAILDKSNTHEKYSQMSAISRAGIPVYIDSKVRIAHNKVIILDGTTTITGSFNFSWSAEHRNAENVLMITDKRLAADYVRNFNNRLKQSIPLMQYCFVTAHHHCRMTIVKTWDNILPPAYLSVSDWKQCLAIENKGTWKAYCLPQKRLSNCPIASWKKLTSGHLVTACKL